MSAVRSTSVDLESNAPTQPSNVLPIDDSSPRITLLGNGTQSISNSGNVVMLDLVEYESAWLDPGARALDFDANGIQVDLTSSLQHFGVAGVNTNHVTPVGEEFGFSVEYGVSVCDFAFGGHDILQVP